MVKSRNAPPVPGVHIEDLLTKYERRSTRAAPRGEALYAGHSTGFTPHGPLVAGFADLFNTDVRPILMVLWHFKGNVTLIGQSSGGTNILALLASPASVGLFSAAISLSGSPNITMDLATAEEQGT